MRNHTQPTYLEKNSMCFLFSFWKVTIEFTEFSDTVLSDLKFDVEVFLYKKVCNGWACSICFNDIINLKSKDKNETFQLTKMSRFS